VHGIKLPVILINWGVSGKANLHHTTATTGQGSSRSKKPALSPIEGFNRYASFKTFQAETRERRDHVRCSWGMGERMKDDGNGQETGDRETRSIRPRTAIVFEKVESRVRESCSQNFDVLRILKTSK